MHDSVYKGLFFHNRDALICRKKCLILETSNISMVVESDETKLEK